jgi:hypothetical protein
MEDGTNFAGAVHEWEGFATMKGYHSLSARGVLEKNVPD